MAKNILIVAGVVLVGVSGLVWWIYTQDNSQKDIQIVQALEENAVPFVESNKITLFSNMDWCKVLEHDGRLVSETIDSTSQEDCGTRLTGRKDVESFTEEDGSLFKQTQAVLSSVYDGSSVREISFEYPLSYRPEHTQSDRESFGLAFHIDCTFCRIRYVYSPGYDSLPPNIEGEIRYTPINDNWFRVDQDWN